MKTKQVKGELVAKGSNWLIAKDLAGNYRLYNVQPGRKAIVDGVPKTLDQLQMGTMLTSTATTTETPLSSGPRRSRRARCSGPRPRASS